MAWIEITVREDGRAEPADGAAQMPSGSWPAPGLGRGRTRWPGMAILAIVLAWAVAQPRLASAQEEQRDIDAAVWGVSTLELSAGLSLTAMFLWDPEATASGRYSLYVLPPFVAGLGMAALSYQQRWDTTVPNAMHGALWGGLDGFLVGTLIDGLSHERGQTIGPWAYGLAAAGTLAGGVLGATAIEPGAPTEGWLAGPVVGAGFGLVIGTVPAIMMAWNGKDRLARQFFWWSMATGIAGGLLFGVLTPPDEQAGSASIRLLGGRPARPPMMLSLPPWQF
jgi:hypothetical protein